jgi:hypothetical protein
VNETAPTIGTYDICGKSILRMALNLRFDGGSEWFTPQTRLESLLETAGIWIALVEWPVESAGICNSRFGSHALSTLLPSGLSAHRLDHCAFRFAQALQCA